MIREATEALRTKSIRRNKSSVLKRNVFKCRLQLDSQLRSKTFAGRNFQMSGAE